MEVLKCPAFYGQVKSYCRSNKCPPIVLVMRQTNPAHTGPSTPRSSKWFISFTFPISYTLTHLPVHRGLASGFFHSGFPISYSLPVRTICPVHLILLDSLNGTTQVACQCATFSSLLSPLPAEKQESFSTHIFDYSRSLNCINVRYYVSHRHTT